MHSTCFSGGSRPGRNTDPLGIVNYHQQYGSLKNSVVALWREWSIQWVGKQIIVWPPGSQASSRGEAKDSALLSSRDAGLLEPTE